MLLLSKSELVKSVCQLYDVTTQRFAVWFPIFWNAAMPYTKMPKMNALHLAVFNRPDDMICSLITRYKLIISYPDNTRMDALQWASLRGHYEAVQMLLDKVAKLNAQDRFYGNALHAASTRGHLEIVRILREKGAISNLHLHW